MPDTQLLKLPFLFPPMCSGFYEWPGLSSDAIWGSLFFSSAIQYFDNATLLAGLIPLNVTLINNPNTRECSQVLFLACFGCECQFVLPADSALL